MNTRKLKQFRPRLYTLSERIVPTVSTTLSGGNLLITSDAADTVNITVTATTIDVSDTINPIVSTPKASVTGTVSVTGTGYYSRTITLDLGTNSLNNPVSVSAGPGSDTISVVGSAGHITGNVTLKGGNFYNQIDLAPNASDNVTVTGNVSMSAGAADVARAQVRIAQFGKATITGNVSLTGGPYHNDLYVAYGAGSYAHIQGGITMTGGAGVDFIKLARYGTVKVDHSVVMSGGAGNNSVQIAQESSSSATIGGSASLSSAGPGSAILKVARDGFATITGNVTLTGGSGDNHLYVAPNLGSYAHITGSLNITGGPLYDQVRVATNGNAVITGSVTINEGNGNNQLYMGTLSSPSINGSLTITAGTGLDFVTITNVHVGTSTTIALGDGFNFTTLNQSFIGGSLSIVPSIPTSPQPATGTGADLVYLGSDNITGSVTATLGDGNNQFGIGEVVVAPSFVGGSITVTTGSGDDLIEFAAAATLTVNGSVTINAGGGTNTWEMDNDFIVKGSLIINSTGAFTDSLTLFATPAGKVCGNILVNLGDGTNLFTFNGTDGTSASTGLVQYTGGKGVDSVTLNGKIGRQLIVSLGDGDDFFTYGSTFTLWGSTMTTPVPSTFHAFVDGGAGHNTFANNSALGVALTMGANKPVHFFNFP
jgi:hypothetical protein